MNQSTATIKSFSGLTDLKEVCAQLDFVFARLQDALQTNPSTHSLLDAKEPVPQHVAGDLILDFRDGSVVAGMSDGKNVQPLSANSISGPLTPEIHGALDSAIYDASGTFVSQLHFDATSTVSGFMSATDKVKLTSISASSATPVLADASAGTAGVATTYSRGDHTHQVSVGTPVTIATANSAGTSVNLARADHVHAHGNQAGGALHSVATTGTNGFMIAADKTELDRLNALNIAFYTQPSSPTNKYIVLGGYYFGPSNINVAPA